MMKVLRKIQGLRADANAIIEIARTQKNPDDVSGLLRYAESMNRRADELELTISPLVVGFKTGTAA